MAVNRSGGNLTRAAKLLGISRAKLAYRFNSAKGSGEPPAGERAS